jgi:hypothetical protein
MGTIHILIQYCLITCFIRSSLHDKSTSLGDSFLSPPTVLRQMPIGLQSLRSKSKFPLNSHTRNNRTKDEVCSCYGPFTIMFFDHVSRNHLHTALSISPLFPFWILFFCGPTTSQSIALPDYLSFRNKVSVGRFFSSF